MPRAFMDRTGFKVAAPGKDARIATGIDILMSSDFSNFALYVSGIAALTLTTLNPGGGAPSAARYRVGVINFGKTFAAPPMAFVGAIKPNGFINCAPLGNFASSGGGNVMLPHIYWTTSTTQLTIYVQCNFSSIDGVSYDGPDATTAAYYVLENTIT